MKKRSKLKNFIFLFLLFSLLLSLVPLSLLCECMIMGNRREENNSVRPWDKNNSTAIVCDRNLFFLFRIRLKDGLGRQWQTCSFCLLLLLIMMKKTFLRSSYLLNAQAMKIISKHLPPKHDYLFLCTTRQTRKRTYNIRPICFIYYVVQCYYDNHSLSFH